MSIIKSHGSGLSYQDDFYAAEWSHGAGTIIEETVKIFNHRNVKIGELVYIGHDSILKGYISNTTIEIGDGCWIGERCYMNGAGGIEIQSTLHEPVGIGPNVTILTSEHDILLGNPSVMRNPLRFDRVILKKGCDIGCATVILPGVTIGQGAIVGAGSVVTKNIPDMEIWAGNPARLLRKR